MLDLPQSHKASPPLASSVSDQPVHYKHCPTRLGWLLPVVIAVIVYGVSLNNYFTYDDFIWLNRARTFSEDWPQMFRPDVVYFDPLVHLLFRINYLIGGLDPRWYHGVDLAIHAANAVLVYRFARLLSGNNKSAYYHRSQPESSL